MAGPRIFVVGTGENVLHVAELLSAQLYDVCLCHDANDFYSAVQQRAPEVVLLHSYVKGLMPIELSERYRVPIISLIEMHDADYFKGGLQDGVADFVTLPVRCVDALSLRVKLGLETTRLRLQNSLYSLQLEKANEHLSQSLDLLQQDHQAAKAVQSQLLPQTDLNLSGLNCQFLLKPSLYLSGDFVDYFEVSPGVVGFCFADVAGHGASSAMITIILKMLSNRIQRYLQRGILQSGDFTPAAALGRMNRELLAMNTGKHLTCFAGEINTNNNTLRYASAGQYPPPLILQRGELIEMDSKGLPLGISSTVDYPLNTVDLDSQFTMCLCSDGVFEVISGESLDEKMKTWRYLVSETEGNLTEIRARLMLDDQIAPPDDIAVLTICR